MVLPPPTPDTPGFTNSNSGINITAVVSGAITVRFGPATPEGGRGSAPNTIVLTDPAPSFATTQILHGGVEISINDVSKSEGNSGTTAVRSRSPRPPTRPQPVTVDFATANGTATAPSDYAATRGRSPSRRGATRRR